MPLVIDSLHRVDARQYIRSDLVLRFLAEDVGEELDLVLDAILRSQFTALNCLSRVDSVRLSGTLAIWK